MNTPVPRSQRLVWIALGLTAVLLASVFFMVTFSRSAGGPPLPDYGQVADFTLTNQDGQAISLANLRGRVWVADVIFTRCPGPCLKMSKQMHDPQQALPTDTPVRLVTMTTDPGDDSPSGLKRYAGRFGADLNRWWFLTGTREEIGALVGGSLKLSAVAKTLQQQKSATDLYIHSTIFVIVDKHARLRDIIETTGDDIQPGQVQEKLLTGLRQLERES